jgi:hypothetical protein
MPRFLSNYAVLAVLHGKWRYTMLGGKFYGVYYFFLSYEKYKIHSDCFSPFKAKKDIIRRERFFSPGYICRPFFSKIQK